MRRLLPLLCVLFGCERPGPGDAVYLFGAFTGAPAEVAFALERAEGGSPEVRPRFEPFSQVETDREGLLAVELTAADVWGEAFDTGAPNRLRLVPLRPHGGLTVSLEMTGDAELPRLPLDGLTIGWTASRALTFTLPATPVLPPSAQFANTPEEPNPTAPAAVLEVAVGGVHAWRDWAPTPGMSLDTVLEDFQASLTVRAVSTADWTHDPLLAASPSMARARFEWRATVSTPPGVTLPLSRGARCGEGVCPWTDGALERVPFAPETSSLELQLLEASSPNEVVVRGLQLAGWADTVLIEGLQDGSWVSLAQLPIDSQTTPRALLQWPADSAFDAPLPSPQATLYLRGPLHSEGPVSAVRLSALDWQGQPAPLGAMQELSVFAGRGP